MRPVVLLAILLGGLSCGSVQSRMNNEEEVDAGGIVPLQITSTTPTADQSSVAVDATIVVEFSDVIDASSADASSVALTGAGGPVAGGVAVDGATVTFTPAAPLHLLATYALQITTAIASATGQTLEAPFELTFQVVDGSWSERTDLADDIAQVGAGPLVWENGRGDAIMSYVTTGESPGIEVIEFDTGSRAFSPPTLVAGTSGKPILAGPLAAMNDDGDAMVVWSTGLTRSWTRRRGDVWDPPSTTLDPGLGLFTLTADGTAVLAMDVGDDAVQVSTMPTNANAWTPGVRLFTDATLLNIAASTDRAEIVAYDKKAEQLVTRGWAPGAGPDEPQTLSPTGVSADWVWFGGFPGGGIVLTWSQDESEVWYAPFDLASHTWSPVRLAAGAYGSAVCANAAGVRIATFIAGGSIFAVHGRPGETFSAPRNLGSPAGIQYAYCELDEWGNGHLFWASYETPKSYRARFAGGEFSEAVELDDGPTLQNVIRDPTTGQVRAVFFDGQRLQVRTFQ